MFKELLPLLIAFGVIFILAIVATIVTNVDTLSEIENKIQEKIINDNSHINIDCIPIWTWNADENLGEFTDVCK